MKWMSSREISKLNKIIKSKNTKGKIILITDDDIKEFIEEFGYTFNYSYRSGKRLYVNATCQNGHTYNKRYDGFKAGYKCKECQKLKYEDIKQYIESFGYILLSTEYISYHDKLDMICPNGHKISMQYSNFKYGKRCAYCANTAPHTYEYIKEKIESEGYKLISTEYIRESAKLKIKCPNGHVYEAPYGSFRKGHRCPYCQRSIGEEHVTTFLKEHNISFNSEYIFKDCVDKWFLRFDFYIKDLNTCIEYDGRQHFEPVNYGGNQTKEELIEQLHDIQRKDQIKTEYCELNGIRLIRIPYTELNNIDEILTRELL